MTDEERKRALAKKIQENEQRKKAKKPEESLYTKLAKKGWLGEGAKSEVEKHPGTTLLERASKKFSYED